MQYYVNCPECCTALDLDEALEEERSDNGTFAIGHEFGVEVPCPKCKVDVTVDCEVTFEFNANIY